MLYNTFKYISSVLLCLIVMSCSCATTDVGSKPDDNLAVPVSSFLKLEASLVVRDCDEQTGECEVKKQGLLSGSGFVVGKARNGGSFVMSAAHVCDPSDFAARVANHQPHYVEFIGLTKDMEGFKVHVLEVDHSSDLCLMWAPELDRVPLKIAEQKMRPGQRIWNVAAPKGVLYRGAPIIIDGIFNGTNLDSGHDMYTMFVRGGSSGSCILNERHEIVGVVSMMDIRFGWIAISPRYEDVYEFHQRAMAYHKDVGKKTIRIALPDMPSMPDVQLPEVDLEKLLDDLLGQVNL